jgi:hypothetical protein
MSGHSHSLIRDDPVCATGLEIANDLAVTIDLDTA